MTPTQLSKDHELKIRESILLEDASTQGWAFLVFRFNKIFKVVLNIFLCKIQAEDQMNKFESSLPDVAFTQVTANLAN